MAEANDTYKIIYQNLIDAGCDESITEKCMFLVKERRVFDMLPILTKHRKYLLDSVHKVKSKLIALIILFTKFKKKLFRRKR